MKREYREWTYPELRAAREAYEADGTRAAMAATGRSLNSVKAMALKRGWRSGRGSRPYRDPDSIAAKAIAMAGECGVTMVELCAETGCGMKYARTLLPRLAKNGELVRVGIRPAMYKLP